MAPPDDEAGNIPLPKSPTPPFSETCDECGKVLSASNEAILTTKVNFHVTVCPFSSNNTLKPDNKDKFVFAKLVHEHELNKMEVKTKCGEMSPVDWRRFSERWAV